MKKIWWVGLLVFALGVGTGVGIYDRQEIKKGELPVFSQQTTLPETVPAETREEAQPVEAIPCRLQYTNLEILGLIAYDGPYLEDGTDESVTNVAALLLYNSGTIGIEYVQIVVFQDGKELSFDATYIPPKGTILILESSRAPFSETAVDECRCRTLIPGSFDWSAGQILVETSGLGSLVVTNLTQTAFSCVRIYYKQYDAESDMCLGGISYSTVVTDLQPGQETIISPYHFAVGYGRVVAVMVEP